MVRIIADTVLIERALRAHCEQLVAAGGRIDPDVSIRCVDQDLSVHYGGTHDDSRVLFVPFDALIPVEDGMLALEGDDVIPGKGAKVLGEAQRHLLQIQCEIFNLTHKIKATREGFPRFVLREDPELLRLLSDRRSPDEAVPAKLAGSNGPGDLLAAFLDSRVLGWPRDDPGEPDRIYLMSLIDYVNHHAGGGAYELSRETERLFVTGCRPSAGSREVFTRYGPYDAHDFLMRHGFVDESATFLRSAGFSLKLRGLGTVHVGTALPGLGRRLTPERRFDLSWTLPRTAVRPDGDLEISNLCIVTEEDPTALRRALTMGLVVWRRGLPQHVITNAVADLERAVLAETRAYYSALGALASDASRMAGGPIAALAAVQQALLDRYETSLTEA